MRLINPQMMSWFKNRQWRKSKAVTDSEMALIRALLNFEDKRSESLLTQLKEAPYVLREKTKSGYKLTIPYITCDPIEIDQTITSRKLKFKDSNTNQELTFQIQVLRGGFLNNFTGEVSKGNWPQNWQVSSWDIENLEPLENWLPNLMDTHERNQILRKLSAFCSLDYQDLENVDLSLHPPASETEIEEVELKEGLGISSDYKEFLKISNGISIYGGVRPYEILGTKDLFTVEVDDQSHWVISDLQDEGAVVLNKEGLVSHVYPSPFKLEPLGNFKKYLQDTLEIKK